VVALSLWYSRELQGQVQSMALGAVYDSPTTNCYTDTGTGTESVIKVVVGTVDPVRQLYNFWYGCCGCDGIQ
jgi:hypothetical protein